MLPALTCDFIFPMIFSAVVSKDAGIKPVSSKGEKKEAIVSVP